MYRINLIGDIDSSKDFEVINDKLLSSELEKAQGQDLEIIINSYGGEVDEAFKMFERLEQYKRENKATITTITDENCASSGVILLLAGNRRIVNNNSNPFVHNAWVNVYGANSNDLKEIAEDLAQCDLKIAELYAKKTSLTIEQSLELMGLDTFFTPEECYDLGFATELSKVYNHKRKDLQILINNKLNINKQMSKEQTFSEKVLNLVNEIFGNEKQEEKTEIQNKKESTITDVEIDFYELDSDANPTIGDKAQIEGKPAEGEYKMKNGKEYEFEGGVLKEIKEEIEEEEVIEVVEENKVDESLIEIENLKSEIENFKTEIQEKDTLIQNLQTELNESKSKIEKFNKLESEFQELNKKEQRESKEVVTENTINFNKIKNNLKQIK